MPNGFMTAERLYELNEERSRAYGRATAEADADALRRKRAALIEAALAEALFQHPEALRGLDPAVAAARIAQAFGD